GGVAALVGVGLGRREGAVFLGGGEVEPGALDRAPALLPGLDRHRVAAARQRPSQGDRREDVAGIAEGGGEDADHGAPIASPAAVNRISGMWQWGESRSRQRTASPMSEVRIMSSAGTEPLMKSVMSVSTKAGASAVQAIPSPPTSRSVATLKLSSA